MLKRRDFLFSSAALFGAALAPTVLRAASDFPSRPIKLVVPFAPGGGVDVFARLIGQKLKDLKGYTVVIDNRSGANGTTGGSAVRKADPRESEAGMLDVMASWAVVHGLADLLLSGRMKTLQRMEPAEREAALVNIIARFMQG